MILNFVRVTSRAGAGSHQARPVSCSQKLKSNKKLLLVFAAAPRPVPLPRPPSRPQSVLSPGFFVARELNITNLVTVLSSPPHRENVFQKVSVGTPPPAQRVAAWCSVCRWRDEKQDQVIAASASRGGGGGKGGKLNGIYFHCSRDQIFTLVG